MRRMIPQNKIEVLDKINYSNDQFVIDGDELEVKGYLPLLITKDAEEKNGWGFIGNYGQNHILYTGVIDEQTDGESIIFKNGNIIINTEGSLILNTDTNIIITNLPTSNPGVAGALWNDNGVLKISAGS